MAPIITPKKGLNRKRHIQQQREKSSRVTICCTLDRIFIPTQVTRHQDSERKKYSGATNSSSIDLRALNSDVKWTFIVSCKLVKQTIHSARFLCRSEFCRKTFFPLVFVLSTKKGRKMQSQQACSSRKWIVYLFFSLPFNILWVFKCEGFKFPIIPSTASWKIYLCRNKHEGKIITQHIRFYLWMKHYYMAEGGKMGSERDQEETVNLKSAFYGNS